MTTKSLEQIHLSKTGKVSDKWSSYFSYYDSIFSSIRNTPVNLLEIGVQNGGSLETWAEYFKYGKIFIGCDINPKCGVLKYEDTRINIIVGDANSPHAHQEIQTIADQFDIVIDDGSHLSNDIINSFLNYFPLVKPGGIYVIEDTHTLYYDSYGGGVLNEFSAYSFFKKIIDIINFQFWENEVSISVFFRTFFSHNATPDFILEGWVDSIEFKNSLITIKKSTTPGHQKLGLRVITGNEAIVQDWGGVKPDPKAMP